MPLFETKIPIDEEHVKKIVLQKWGVKIQKILKASQNHTFQGAFEESTQTKCAVRVTPDPDGKHFQRIKDELTFVQYCADHKLNHVCGPILTKGQNKQLYVKDGNLVIAVFQWAKGEPVNFFDLKWMTDVPLIQAWGRYFAQLHKISKKFSHEQPEIAKRIQNWNQIHHGVLSKIKLAEQDQKDVDNPLFYGVIHGDLNTSNSYYNRQKDHFSVYDSDQTQRGFYQWDLAQAIFGIVMLKQAGMPISGNPVPQANQEFFEGHLISGYEKVAGKGAINQQRLKRMVDMKRQFYRLFCVQAIKEGDIPKQMEAFIHFIEKALNKPKGQIKEQKKQEVVQESKQQNQKSNTQQSQQGKKQKLQQNKNQ